MENIDKQNELKHCPFCGSDKIVKTTIDGWGISKYRRARIECKNCGLKTRYFEEEFKGEYVEEYWNRRVNNENIQ
jgi:Lar family restriction alleviation protein